MMYMNAFRGLLQTVRNRRWSPVSYTHLDVYKRQGLTREDKYNTVKAYINGDIVNANILDLIMNGRVRG